MPSFFSSRVIALPGAEGSTDCHDRPAAGREVALGREAEARQPPALDYDRGVQVRVQL